MYVKKGQQTDRAGLYIASHKRKTGEILPEASSNVEQMTKKIAEAAANNTPIELNGPNDIVFQVLGNETHGRLRVSGVRPTQTRTWAKTQGKGMNFQRENQSLREDLDVVSARANATESKVDAAELKANAAEAKVDAIERQLAQMWALVSKFVEGGKLPGPSVNCHNQDGGEPDGDPTYLEFFGTT